MYIQISSKGAVGIGVRDDHLFKFLAWTEFEQGAFIVFCNEKFKQMCDGENEKALYKRPGRSPLVLLCHKHGTSLDIDLHDAPTTDAPQPARASWYQRFLKHVPTVGVTVALLSLAVGVAGVARHWF